MMQEAIIGLVIAVAGIIPVLGVGLKLLFDRMKALEKDNKELKEAQQKVPRLEEQVRILTLQIGEMQTRLSEAENTLDGKERELERLVDETAAQKVALKERDAALAAMVVRVETYERALALVGGERRAPAPEAGESTETGKEQETERGT